MILTYAWRELTRRKTRTTLTVMSIFFAIGLFTAVLATLNFFKEAVSLPFKDADADMVVETYVEPGPWKQVKLARHLGAIPLNVVDEIQTLPEVVDLLVKGVELAVLVGVSGSGKTSLLNLIGGLDVPTLGSVLVDGTDISKMDSKQLTLYQRQKIGFVFQFFYLIPTLTVFENVMFPLVPLPMDAKEKRERVLQLIEEVGLSERINHLPSELSGGEQQRVAIARALVNDPQILLADEPTSDLDTETGNQIIELLSKFHARDKTVIIATHDERLTQIAAHIVRMRDGRVVEELRKE